MKANSKSLNKKILSTFGLVLLSPFLMGAKTPYSATSPYYSLEYTVEKQEKLPEEEYFTYEFKITNKGTGYIAWNQSFIFYDKNDKHSYLNAEHPHFLFGHEALFLPSEEIRINWKLTDGELDLNNGYFRTYAYEEVDGTLSYSGTNAITKIDDGLYVIDCVVSNMKDSMFSKYYFAVTIDYDGVEYCSLCYANEDNKVYFNAIEEFDMSKATVKKIVAYEEEQYHPNYAGFAIGGVLMILVPAAIIFLIIAIVTATTLILVFGLRKKNKKQ